MALSSLGWWSVVYCYSYSLRIVSVVVVVYFLVLVVYFLTVDWLPFLQVHPYIVSYDHELLVQLLDFSASFFEAFHQVTSE